MITSIPSWVTYSRHLEHDNLPVRRIRIECGAARRDRLRLRTRARERFPARFGCATGSSDVAENYFSFSDSILIRGVMRYLRELRANPELVQEPGYLVILRKRAFRVPQS